MLGVNPKQLLFRRIYEKLFFYEVYHAPLNIALGEEGLDKFLSEVNVNRNDMDELTKDTNELKYAMEDEEELAFADTKTSYCIDKYDIYVTKIDYWEASKNKKEKYATEYTFTLPGVSVEEFIKNDSLGTKFNHSDVEEAFKLLVENGLIKPCVIFRGQTRFIIANHKLRNLIEDLKWIHSREWSFLLYKWECFHAPTREEYERMNWLLGEEETERIFRKAEMSRHNIEQVMRGKIYKA
jgi:hypothetical protein